MNWGIKKAVEMALSGVVEMDAPWKEVFDYCTEMGEKWVHSHAVLGILYEHGLGTAKFENRSIEHYKKAAFAGHGDSAMKLAAKDTDREMWLKIASSKGVLAAHYALAKESKNEEEILRLYLLCGNDPKAIRKRAEKLKDMAAYDLLKPIADQGDLKACLRLYLILSNPGSAPFSDVEKSRNRYYLEKAAMGGLQRAFKQIGYCYLTGNNQFPVNYKLAVHWFEKAGDSDGRALFRLGECYEKQLHYTKCNWKAFEKYQRAASLKDRYAIIAMGRLLLSGMPNALDEGKKDLLPNPESAIAYLTEVADLDAEAAFLLGKCFLEGTGTPLNEFKAQEWLEKAKTLGFAAALPTLRAYYKTKYEKLV